MGLLPLGFVKFALAYFYLGAPTAVRRLWLVCGCVSRLSSVVRCTVTYTCACYGPLPRRVRTVS